MRLRYSYSSGFRRLAIAILGLLVFTATPYAHAQQIVAPNSLTSVEGSTDNRYPFFVNGGIRYQQVYNATQFTSLSAPSLITQINFRPDSRLGSAFAATNSNVLIRLSTTSAAADGLSSTFASNLGANTTTVYSGSLSLSSAFTGPLGGPKSFDVVINLTSSFLYNPADGNLLLDVTNFSPEDNNFSALTLDATFVQGDSTSRLISAEGDPNATTGTSDSSGLVTRFTFAPAISANAPEPGSLALLLPVVGTVGLVLRKRRRK